MNNQHIKELHKFPILLYKFEIEFLANKIVNRKDEIPEICAQIKSYLCGGEDNKEEKFTIYMNASEICFIKNILNDNKARLPELWKQLSAF